MVNPNLQIFFLYQATFFNSIHVNALLRKAPVHCYIEISLIISKQIIEPEDKN